MGACQSLYPKPKEEFPPTGVQAVDSIVNDVKGVIAILNKSETMINEFKTKANAIQPPAEGKELFDKANALIEAPQKLTEENVQLFKTIPEMLQNPSKLLANPLTAIDDVKKKIGDPADIIKKYENIIEDYKKFGVEAKEIPPIAAKKAEEYKTFIDVELMGMVNYLNEVLKIAPIFQDLVGKLNQFEEDLKAELKKFPGGPCAAAKTMIAIQHNINSVNRYKKKYEPQIEEVKKIADQALEKKKEVDGAIETAKGYQQQAEKLMKDMEEYQHKVEGLQTQAKTWMDNAENLKKMMATLQSGDIAGGIQNGISNLASGFGKFF